MRPRPSGERRPQIFKYYIALALETTGWDRTRRVGRFMSPPEIIEISAMLLDGTSGMMLDRFQQYVMPSEFPTLTEKCIEKTDILQKYLDIAGIPLEAALYWFDNWIKEQLDEYHFVMKSDQCDTDIDIPLGAFVTWTDWPLGVCLEKECQRKNLIKPVKLNYWIDLKLAFKRFYPGRNPHEDYIDTDSIDQVIVDAVSKASLIPEMILDGAIFTITSSCEKKHTVINTGSAEKEKLEEGQSPEAPLKSEE